MEFELNVEDMKDEFSFESIGFSGDESIFGVRSTNEDADQLKDVFLWEN